MSDRSRIRFAAVCSLVIHVLALYPWDARDPGDLPGTRNTPDPVILNLIPETPRPSRQLVDVLQPSEEAPAESDLISDVNSQAADAELREGSDPGPRFEEEAALDSIALSQPSVMPAPVPAPPQPVPPEAPQAEQPEEGPPPSRETTLVASRPEADPAPAPEETRPDPERAAPEKTLPTPATVHPSASRGRVHDAVKNKGFTNYEAIQDALAPYMKQVRSKVERQWREALLTRYAGTSRTEAEIDCAIGPDGRLISAQVVGNPKDRVYAALCREAIERAGPFGPFPFSVPDMYRSQNLEIRWTFSFL